MCCCRFWANVCTRPCETSPSTPRPNWATFPRISRSVTSSTTLPPAEGMTCAVIVASAPPWPCVSRPTPFITTRREAWSSMNSIVPRYCAPIGPTRTFRVPEYLFPSRPSSTAPGMQGATRLTSRRTSNSWSGATGTSRLFSSFIRCLVRRGPLRDPSRPCAARRRWGCARRRCRRRGARRGMQPGRRPPPARRCGRAGGCPRLARAPAPG